jgi:hypothetical protein
MAHLPPPLEVLPVAPSTQLWRYSSHPGDMDPADSAMSQVCVGSQVWPGGMLLLQAAPSPEPALGDDLLAAAARAAALDALGQPHIGGLTGTGAGEEADMDHEDAQALLSGMDPAASAAAMTAQQQQQQQNGAGTDSSVKNVVMYWQHASSHTAATAAARTSSAVGDTLQQQQQQQQQQDAPGPPLTQQLAAVAQLLVHTQGTITKAEALLGSGRADAALRLLSSGLQAADSWQPPVQWQPPGGAATSSPAAAAGEVYSANHSSYSAQAQQQQQGQGQGAGGAPRVALGPGHVLRLRLLAALLRAAIEAQQWEAALEAARRLTPLYAAVYPKVSVEGLDPSVATQACTLCTACCVARLHRLLCRMSACGRGMLAHSCTAVSLHPLLLHTPWHLGLTL